MKTGDFVWMFILAGAVFIVLLILPTDQLGQALDAVGAASRPATRTDRVETRTVAQIRMPDDRIVSYEDLVTVCCNGAIDQAGIRELNPDLPDGDTIPPGSTVLVPYESVVIPDGRRLSGDAFAVDDPDGEPAIAPEPSLSTPDGAAVVHVVRRGDTLSAIARSYDTTVEELMAYNDLNRTIIHSGQQVTIPPAGYELSAADKALSTVRRAVEIAGQQSRQPAPGPAPGSVYESFVQQYSYEPADRREPAEANAAPAPDTNNITAGSDLAGVESGGEVIWYNSAGDDAVCGVNVNCQ